MAYELPLSATATERISVNSNFSTSSSSEVIALSAGQPEMESNKWYAQVIRSDPSNDVTINSTISFCRFDIADASASSITKYTQHDTTGKHLSLTNIENADLLVIINRRVQPTSKNNKRESFKFPDESIKKRYVRFNTSSSSGNSNTFLSTTAFHTILSDEQIERHIYKLMNGENENID